MLIRLNDLLAAAWTWAGRRGVFARVGVLLSGVWLLCTFADHPWEPIDGAPISNRTRRSPGTAEALTRFFWSVGAQSEESVTNLFWTPPVLPALHVAGDPDAGLSMDLRKLL